MSAIQSMSIGRRLGLLMAASTGVALLLSYAASAYSQIDQYQRDTRAQLSTLADITASNSAAALAFGEHDFQTGPGFFATGLVAADQRGAAD